MQYICPSETVALPVAPCVVLHLYIPPWQRTVGFCSSKQCWQASGGAEVKKGVDHEKPGQRVKGTGRGEVAQGGGDGSGEVGECKSLSKGVAGTPARPVWWGEYVVEHGLNMG